MKMTPKQYAQELVDKQPDVMGLTLRRMSAHVAANEILRVLNGLWGDIALTTAKSCSDTLNHQKYIQQVITEIDNTK